VIIPVAGRPPNGVAVGVDVDVPEVPDGRNGTLVVGADGG
jgi:hypothetical protein